MSAVSRLTKLRAMPLREIAARVGYETYTAYERALYRRGRLAPPDRLRRAIAPELARREDWFGRLVVASGTARFFSGVDSAGRMRPLLEHRYCDETGKARDIAAQVARGEIGFFGRQFSFGAHIDWHADPVTGAAWPRLYHRDMPVHGGDSGYGDVKDVWEVNRHQFFVDLAKVAFLDRSAAHAEALHRLLRHWMHEVPYATGAAWACALEPAFRAWSWLWAYHLVRAAGLLDDATHETWLTGLFDHGRFLHRHLERYSSPYNHLIGEASALFALGLLCPGFAEARSWRDRGRHVLESTLQAQFHADGGTVEQSTFYHHATLGFYLLAGILGRRNGIDLSPAAWQAMERALDFSAALVQPDGRVPRIGGADDGKPIRLEHLPFWDFRPYYAIGAVLFGRRDFRFVAGRFWEDALWLLGPEGLEAFEQLTPQEPPPAAALPSSGYYIVRSDWSASADYLCFDCGEQAAGLRRDDVPSAAHGHADCLSIVSWLGGREVLVDPGFFCYNGDPAWEVHFRRTPAHNTLTIDGRDQARHLSKMAWTRTYAARPEGWSTAEALAWARGSHDGYDRTAQRVTHRRTAWLRPEGYLVLLDELELIGTPGLQASATFQFAPGELTVGDGHALFEGRYELVWACSAPVTARTRCGGDAPADGWIAGSLGVRVPAPRLTLEFPIAASRVVLLSAVADRALRGGAAARMHGVRHENGSPVSLRVQCAGATEEIVAAFGQSGGAGVETDALLFIVRREGPHIAEVIRAGGTYARLRPAVDTAIPQLA